VSALVEVRNLYFRYATGRRSNAEAWTLTDINLSLQASGTLGIVGESGSGKSTLIRIMCGLIPANKGEIVFDGRNIHDWLASDGRGYRTRNQIVFQNPRRSLDPRMTIGTSLSQPIRALERRIPATAELASGLDRVGLSPTLLDRYPHQLSGGQMQRVAIARALSVKPNVLYADEPTSALDVSVQAQVLNLLMDLRDELGLALVMVTHNLAVVGRLTENVLVLKRGVGVEAGRTVDVLSRPSNRYTGSLVEAADEVSLVGGGRPIATAAERSSA
jgi:ABC-type glutathione transport system ATPase component